MTALEARAKGYKVPDEVPDTAVLRSGKVERIEGQRFETSHSWVWVMANDLVTDKGEIWPYRKRCTRCEAWLGLQNPGTICDSCK